MNQVERDLRESMHRRQPPPDFAERVLAKARQSESRWTPGAWLAAAALIVLMIGGGAFLQIQHERAESAKAKEQLMVALRITGTKLRDVQERLIRIKQRAAPTQLGQREN